MTRGKVYLVGAGPGDVGLITVKGLECLRRADVIVYDRLIDDGLLSCARPDAEMIYVGKSSTTHTREQQEINRILVDKASEDKVVVRLKGGDPFVLGRGGEEAEALSAENIPFEVVPGISSAVAVPAYAGIPVTHRGLASSFAVVTGHEDPSKDNSSVDWGKLAAGADTLVCLMGMGHLELILEALLDSGKSPDTPIALIREGTTPGQRTVAGTLNTIVKQAQEADLQPPVVMVIGEVVGLKENLEWFESRPLFGKRVLVTRARAQASALSRLLAEGGAQPIELAAIEIVEIADPSELDEAVQNLPAYGWVLFTSVNGVEAFWKRLRALGRDARWFRNVKIGAIGPATEEALASCGISPDLMPQEHTSEALAEALASSGIDGQRILLPRSDIAPKDLADRLSELGAQPHEVVAYITRPPVKSIASAKRMLADGVIDIVTFTSSSTVNNLVSALEGELDSIKGCTIACIGPVTADAADRAGLSVDIVAEEHTIPGLVSAMEKYFGERES
jgi:uroporphyrinogen III methyltransferase/synthase